MKYKKVISILIIGFLLSSCQKDENPVVPPCSAPFNLKISVKNTSGTPKPNVRIYAWHYVPYMGNWFALSVYKHRLIANFIDDSLRITGTLDTTNYFALASKDSSEALIGYTGTNGVYECNDPRRFPNIFNLPSALDSKDTVKFVLIYGNKSMVVYGHIQYGENSFEIVWNPSLENICDTPKRKGVLYNLSHKSPMLESIADYGLYSITSEKEPCPRIWINFSLPQVAVVTLKIYDLLGHTRDILLDGEILESGTHDIEFIGCYLPAKYHNCF